MVFATGDRWYSGVSDLLYSARSAVINCFSLPGERGNPVGPWQIAMACVRNLPCDMVTSVR